MFTGIITQQGTIAGISASPDPIYTIAVHMERLALGASVACNGVCLTVIAMSDVEFQVQVSGETLAKTTLGHWRVGDVINLERALQAGDELGGHWVSGHVDGVGQVAGCVAEGESWRFSFSVPASLRKFIAPKGSVTINGVSLTVNEVEAEIFGVNIIPHTWAHTTFNALKVGAAVNIEVDMLARYVDRLLELRGI